jgi:transposase
MLYAGIDVAKTFHVLAVVDEEGRMVMKPWTFNNDKAGFGSESPLPNSTAVALCRRRLTGRV